MWNGMKTATADVLTFLDCDEFVYHCLAMLLQFSMVIKLQEHFSLPTLAEARRGEARGWSTDYIAIHR